MTFVIDLLFGKFQSYVYLVHAYSLLSISLLKISINLPHIHSATTQKSKDYLTHNPFFH